MTTDPGDLERTPPHDVEAEQLVLGAAMDSHGVVERVGRVLDGSDDFYRPAHQTIWRALVDLALSGRPTGPIALRDELRRRDELTRVGAEPYLTKLYRAAPIAAQAEHYARIIAEHGARRRALEAVTYAQQRLANPGADPAEIIADTVSALALVRHDEGGQDADRIITGGAFILDAPAAPPAIWGQDTEVAWAAGESLLIGGPPGVGKTTLTGQLVAARLGIVTKTVLGLPVQPGERRVLYLAMDRPPQIARSLGRLFGSEHRGVLDERLAVWKGPPPRDFARHPDLLGEMCERFDADTVIVDSLKDCVRKLSDDESGGGYNEARQRALVAGVQVVELHHQRKANGDNKKPSKLDDIYGSVWLTAGAGSVILLWGEGGDPIVELTHLKQPAEPLGPWRIAHDHAAGRSEIHHQADLLQMAQTWQPSGSAGLTAKAAACALFTTDKPSANETEKARRKLEKLVREGHLIRVDGSGGGSAGGTPTKYYRAAREES